MSRNRFGYYVKEGTGSIFAHGFMSFASVFIIVACLIIMGSFVLLAVNVSAIIGEFERENIILAYVHENLPEAQARAIGPIIEATQNVSGIKFTTREEAMESFFGKYEDQSRFKDLDASVFRHRYEVYVDDVAAMEQTQDQLRQISGIDGVSVNLKIAKGFVTVRNIVSGVSAVIVAILLVVSLFIMSNTVKLATFERREEIAIMKMVGATNAFIRWPFVFEGFLLGISGSLIAYGALWGLYTLVTGKLINTGSAFIATIPFSRVALPVFIVFSVIGFGVGVCGSVMAIRKYLKV